MRPTALRPPAPDRPANMTNATGQRARVHAELGSVRYPSLVGMCCARFQNRPLFFVKDK